MNINKNALDLSASLRFLADSKRKGDLEAIREAYEDFFKSYPDAVDQWIEYIDIELSYDQFDAVRHIFERCLRNSSSPKIYNSYLDFIRRMNGESDSKARTVVNEAFEFALRQIGSDKDSGNLWKEYIAFLKGREVNGNWEEQQKTDAIRRTYQQAVVIPLTNIEQIWSDYNSFEQTLNRGTARKFIAEKSPAYMTARSALKEMEKILAPVSLQTPLPTQPDWSLQESHTCVNTWRKYLLWEKSNPLDLQDSNTLHARIELAFRKALSYMRFYPEIWFMFVKYEEEQGKKSDALAHLRTACESNPGSLLLNYYHAETEENQHNHSKYEKIFENILKYYHDQIDSLQSSIDKQVQDAIAQIDSSATSGSASVSASATTSAVSTANTTPQIQQSATVTTPQVQNEEKEPSSQTPTIQSEIKTDKTEDEGPSQETVPAESQEQEQESQQDQTQDQQPENQTQEQTEQQEQEQEQQQQEPSDDQSNTQQENGNENSTTTTSTDVTPTVAPAKDSVEPMSTDGTPLATPQINITSSQNDNNNENGAEGDMEEEEGGGDQELLASKIKEREQAKAYIINLNAPTLAMLKETMSHIWITYMRFARRSQGLKAMRSVFSRARKQSAYLTWHVFDASAMLEYYCNKETDIAIKVFEVGLRTFGEHVDFVVRYLDFLIKVNDDSNARALFERTVSKIPASKARPIWDRWYKYECRYGDLSAILKLEQRMAEAFPEESAVVRFAERYTYSALPPIGQELGFETDNNRDGDEDQNSDNEQEDFDQDGSEIDRSRSMSPDMLSKKHRGAGGLSPNRNRANKRQKIQDGSDSATPDTLSSIPNRPRAGPHPHSHQHPHQGQQRRGPKEPEHPIAPDAVMFLLSIIPPSSSFSGPNLEADLLMNVVRNADLDALATGSDISGTPPPPSNRGSGGLGGGLPPYRSSRGGGNDARRFSSRKQRRSPDYTRGSRTSRY